MFKAVTRGGWGVALGVGLGVAVLMTRGFRPLAKQAVKGYLVATEGMKRATSGARQGLQDIYEEARAEREGAPPAGASQTGPRP